MRLFTALRASLTLVADLVAPRRCAGCDQPHPLGSAAGAFCPACAPKVLEPAEGPHWAAVQFAGPVRKAVHRLKFESRSDLGRVLGRELGARFLATHPSRATIDLVTCIPLSAHRLAERGYNQAGLISKPISTALGRSFEPGALSRLRDTTKQSSLGREERAGNVDGAFRGSSAIVRGKVVLLVDDVVTTGETFAAAARALTEAGARDVVCVALARAGRASISREGAERDARDDLPRTSR